MSSSRITKPESSTVRRKRLSKLIENFGEVEMVRPCRECRTHGRVCKVHVASGRCLECNKRNDSDCDVRVTENEFNKLLKEHKKLKKSLESAREATALAYSQAAAAQEQVSKALSKEMRLREQMVRLEREGTEAIAVEERGIEEQERGEHALASLSRDWVLEPEVIGGPDLALNPYTWTAMNGIPDEFFEIPNSQPEVAL